MKRHEQSGKAADAFLKQHCCVLKFDQASTAPVMEFMNWKKELSAKLLISEERGHTFSCLNLAAPSMSTAVDMDFFGACASCMSKGQNLMAVIMPQFSCTKGQLYMQSRMIEDLFVNRGLSIDSKWAIPFKGKTDMKDNRPLVYDGRVVENNDKRC